jgi:hypothetical protein
MGKSSQVETVRTAIAYGAIGFGAVALATPRLFAGVYGLHGDGNLRTMVRLWGTSTAVLGALTLLSTDRAQQRTLAALTVALNTVDTVVIAGAGADVATRSRVMGATTSAAFAVASGYVLSQT